MAYNSAYTGAQIDEAIGKVSSLEGEIESITEALDGLDDLLAAIVGVPGSE